MVSAGLITTSVEIFFRTNSFQGEYKEVSDALFVSTKVELLSEIDSLIQQRKAAQEKAPTQPPSSLIFPEANVDYEEDILSSIREIGAEADNWLTSIQRGKTYLRILALFLPLSQAFLFLEYFTGPIFIFLAVYAARYEILVRDLDKAYIELKKVRKS